MNLIFLRSRRWAILLFVLSIFSLTLDAAEEKDQVFLKNGDVVVGDIIQRTTGMIAIRIHDGTVVQIQRYDIENIYSPVKSWRSLFRSGAAPAEEASIVGPASEADPANPADTPGELSESAEGEDGSRAPLSDIPRLSSLYARAYPRADPALEKKILEMIGTLSKKEAPVESVAFFSAHADVAAPYLILHLWSRTDYYVALNSAKMLKYKKRPDSVQFLIEALFAMTPLDGKPKPGVADLMNAIQDVLDASTSDFRSVGIYVNPDSINAKEEMNRWIEWYAAAMDKLPPQIGEGALPSPDSADYAEALNRERALNLSLVGQSWPLPSLEEINLSLQPPEISGAARQRIDSVLKSLSSDDDAERKRAEQELQSLAPQHIDAKTLNAYLAFSGLSQSSHTTRRIVVDYLSKEKARPALRFIIEAMMKPLSKDAIPTENEMAFTKSAFRALENITGVRSFNYPRTRSVAYDRCKQWVDWYQTNRKNTSIIPPQYGEIDLDKEMPNYDENYLKLRSLNLPGLVNAKR